MDYNCNVTEDKYFTQKKIREALVSNEPELREYKSKLDNDFTRKQQAWQIKEKEYRDLQEHINKKRENEALLQKRLSDLKIQENNQQILLKSKLAYRQELLAQIDDKIKEFERKQENMDQNKRDIEKLSLQIKEEIAQNLQEKKDHQRKTYGEMNLQLQYKEVKNIKQRLLSVEEMQRIEKINREVDERLKILKKEKEDKFMLRESLRNKLAANLLAQKIADNERAQLIRDLEEFEYLQKDSVATFNDYYADLAKRQTLGKILKTQIKANASRAQQLKIQETEFVQQLNFEVQKQKELDEVERSIIQLRGKQYSLEIEKQIDDNIKKRENTNNDILMTHEYVLKYNQEKKKQIEEEMSRMLEEHNLKVTSLR